MLKVHSPSKYLVTVTWQEWPSDPNLTYMSRYQTVSCSSFDLGIGSTCFDLWNCIVHSKFYLSEENVTQVIHWSNILLLCVLIFITSYFCPECFSHCSLFTTLLISFLISFLILFLISRFISISISASGFYNLDKWVIVQVIYVFLIRPGGLTVVAQSEATIPGPLGALHL